MKYLKKYFIRYFFNQSYLNRIIIFYLFIFLDQILNFKISATEYMNEEGNKYIIFATSGSVNVQLGILVLDNSL